AKTACSVPGGKGGSSGAPLTKWRAGIGIRSARPGSASSRVGMRSFVMTGSLSSHFARRQQLPDQARLALEKTLRVKRLVERQQGEVEMVTDLVEQRAHEGSKRHHPALLGRAHPDANARAPAFDARVQAVELFLLGVRPH